MRRMLVATALSAGLAGSLAFGAFWWLGSSAQKRVQGDPPGLSHETLVFAITHHISLDAPFVNCYDESPGFLTLRSWKISLEILSLAKRVESAEYAADRYASEGNSKMAELATRDAIDRSLAVSAMEARLSRINTIKARRSY